MVVAIDILQSSVIARPRVEIDRGVRPLLEIVETLPIGRALAQSQPIVRSRNRTIRCDCGFLNTIVRRDTKQDYVPHRTAGRELRIFLLGHYISHGRGCFWEESAM